MSPVEEIRAAIDKLTILVKNSEDISPMPWTENCHHIQDAVSADVANFEVMPDVPPVLVLRDTTDAQLSILRAGAVQWSLNPDAVPNAIMQHAHYFAISINGKETK